MGENFLTIYFLGSKEKVKELQTIFQKLGFSKEKETLNCRLENGRWAIIFDYKITDEQLQDARKLFDYVKVKKI
jgi:hypothetical protein